MKEVKQPLMSEKATIVAEQPNRPDGRATAKQRKLQLTRRLVLWSVLSFLAFVHLGTVVHGKVAHARAAARHAHRLQHAASYTPDDVDPYLGAVLGRGMGAIFETGATSDETELDLDDIDAEKHHKKHGKHHGHKHDKDHDKHGKHHKDDKHGKHGKHHGGKDDEKHHGKHGKHGDHHDHPHPHPPHRPPPPPHRRPPFVPPKMAEEIFLSVPNNDSVRAASKRYTAYAHPAGSGFDFVSALNLKNEWERALGLPSSGPEEFLYDAGSPESQARIYDGMDKLGVWIDTYYPVMNTPVDRAVTLFSDPPFHAKLQEDIVEEDPTSILRDEVPVFHGLSTSGDVTGKLVYAGYGRKRDFELLEAKGIDVKGKIAIVKYGGVFRGLKVKAAQEAGALGCIIFTDPADDGEINISNGYEPYPAGPARQPSSIQRGSVQFLSKYPGDPTTPGEPAYPNATRIDGANFPSIPSLPMSYQDAAPLLKSLNGKGLNSTEFGDYWEGGLGELGVDYFTGPSDLDVRLMNEVNTRVMPIWNTMATIPGYITDEVIVIGNHRDAWILGGSDPNSGTASQYELIRGLGKLLSKGWKPLRSIVLASWDAEEYGLIGSTEWAEDFGSWLSEKNAAYLNLDSSVSGSVFGASASPSLAWLTRHAADEINSSADAEVSVWAAATRSPADKHHDWRAPMQPQAAMAMMLAEGGDLVGKHDTNIGPLGSGSDFTAFLQRYGVASSAIGYAGGPRDPVYHYHSIYDSFYWQDKYADPGFHKHADAARVLGLMTLRLADSLILPLNTTQYSLELQDYLAKVKAIAKASEFESDVDFSSLANSIKHLIGKSMELDAEKDEAIKKLHKLLPPPPPRGPPHHKHERPSVFVQIGQALGFVRRKCSGAAMGWRRSALPQVETWTQQDDAWYARIAGEVTDDEDDSAEFPYPPHRDPRHPPHPPHHPPHGPPPHHPPHHPPPPHMPDGKKMKEIKAVLKQIRAINKKVQGFEKGFISKEGITDREWYKHKGVAPGKWLGYGATTFPALTEAFTIEKDAKLAQKEADELADMIGQMAMWLAKND